MTGLRTGARSRALSERREPKGLSSHPTTRFSLGLYLVARSVAAFLVAQVCGFRVWQGIPRGQVGVGNPVVPGQAVLIPEGPEES